MRSLILLRHGEAERAAESGRDVDRALTPAGREAAAAAGRRLAQSGVRPTLALVSPARRAHETWQAAAPAFPGVESRTEPGLLHTEARAILAAAEASGADAVVVVGHNPGLAELVGTLARTGGSAEAVSAFAAQGFAPASAAVFSPDGDGWALDAFLPPAGGDQ